MSVYAGDHQMRVEESAPDSSYSVAWRWACSCGTKGRWQWQSPTCCTPAWKRHLRKLSAS